MAVAESKKTDENFHKNKLHKVIGVLAIAFFTIWIVIGLVFLLFIFANFRQGAFNGLLGGASGSQVSPQVSAPAEVDLPGVGMVNVECVQASLSQESILKLQTDGGTDNFTADENAALETCIVESDAAKDSS